MHELRRVLCIAYVTFSVEARVVLRGWMPVGYILSPFNASVTQVMCSTQTKAPLTVNGATAHGRR